MGTAVAAHGHAGAGHVDDEAKVRLGMRFYVITDVIFVVFLFASYVWLRAYNTGDAWFPKGTKLPDAATTNVLTLLIAVSGVCFFVAYLGARADNQLLIRGGLVAALVLEVVTLVGQIRFMGHLPFTTTDGSFPSTFIMLSGYHVYHLLIALFLGVGVTHRALRGRYSKDKMLGIITIGYFWYWTALMPILLWLLMLALPPKI
jgi:cytochrome c oxidase subunit III